MLMVVAPTEQELAGLRRALQYAAPPAISAQSLELHTVGMGRGAGQVVAELLASCKKMPPGERRPPDGVLLLGFAGALDSVLDTGQLVVSRRYFCSAGQELREPKEADGELWRRATRASDWAGLALRSLDSLTVEHLVASAAEKQALAQSYPAGTVNMEDYWVASAAQEAAVPFLSVRAVLDVSTQRLPGYVLELPRSRAKAALSLASRPWRVPAALGLGRQAAVASAGLARFAMAFSRQESVAPAGR